MFAGRRPKSRDGRLEEPVPATSQLQVIASDGLDEIAAQWTEARSPRPRTAETNEAPAVDARAQLRAKLEAREALRASLAEAARPAARLEEEETKQRSSARSARSCEVEREDDDEAKRKEAEKAARRRRRREEAAMARAEAEEPAPVTAPTVGPALITEAPEEPLSAEDAERAAMWRELGAYADGLQSKADFPDNYDEVVGLMNRRDLRTEGWATTALKGGAVERYRGLLGDDKTEETKLLAGLATIERLDRELAKCQAKARAVRDLAALEPPPAPVEVPPSPATSVASTATSATGAFLTEKRLEKRPKDRRSRFAGQATTPLTARSEASDEKPSAYLGSPLPRAGNVKPDATDYLLDNACAINDGSLLTMAQRHRCAQLELGDESDDDVLLDLCAYGDSNARLSEIDAELRALGHDQVVFEPLPTAEERAKRAKGERAADDDAAARDFLTRARERREARSYELSLDKRIATARHAPLAVADDSDEDDDVPLYAVRPAEIRELLSSFDAVADPVPRERIDDLLRELAPRVHENTTLRAERRRKRCGEEEAEVFREEVFAMPAGPAPASKRRARAKKALGELEDAILEASLRTSAALKRSDALLARAPLGDEEEEEA